MTRSQQGVREVLDQHDLLFSVGGDLFTLVAAVEDRADAAGPAAHPSRHRPLADRQELSGAGRHLRRPQGARCPTSPRRVRERMTRRRARPRRASAAEVRERRHQGRARGVPRQGARARRQDAGAAARAARSDRRDAAEGRGGDRGGAVVGARRALADQQRRPAELLRAARRRHRLGPAGGDRRQARAARPAGGRADRRRQRACTRCRRCGPPRTTGCR